VVVKTKKNGSMTWKVIDSIDPDLAEAIAEIHDNFEYGLKRFYCENYKKSEVISSIFLRLLFKDWRKKVEKLNEVVVASK
jgi:hypothetical protein